MKGKEEKDFDTHLFDLVHDESQTEDILRLFGIRMYDKIRKKKPRAVSIIDKACKLAVKYLNLEGHFEFYIHEHYDSFIDPASDFYHITDYNGEAKLEIIHSLLLSRIGLANQAIITLRRAYEAALLGTFYATTTYHLRNKQKINPFTMLNSFSLWATKMNTGIRHSDLKIIVEELSAALNITKSSAIDRIHSDFTGYYLRNICKSVCKYHLNDSVPACPLFFQRNTKCDKCDAVAGYILVERPVTMDLIISVIKNKIQTRYETFIDLTGLYNDLSAFVHPNPQSHQHIPDFRLSPLYDWLELLDRTLTILLWLHIKSCEFLGFREQSSFYLLESNNYDLKKISLDDLANTICSKIGQEYRQKKM